MQAEVEARAGAGKGEGNRLVEGYGEGGRARRRGRQTGRGKEGREGGKEQGVQGDAKGARWMGSKITGQGGWSPRSQGKVGGVNEHRAYLAIWQEACAVLGPVAGLATLEADMVGVLVPLQVLPTVPSLRQEAVCSNSQLMQPAYQLLCSM